MKFIVRKEYFKPNIEEAVSERFVQIGSIKYVSSEFEGNIKLRTLSIGSIQIDYSSGALDVFYKGKRRIAIGAVDS